MTRTLPGEGARRYYVVCMFCREQIADAHSPEACRDEMREADSDCDYPDGTRESVGSPGVDVLLSHGSFTSGEEHNGEDHQANRESQVTLAFALPVTLAIVIILVDIISK